MAAGVSGYGWLRVSRIRIARIVLLQLRYLRGGETALAGAPLGAHDQRDDNDQQEEAANSHAADNQQARRLCRAVDLLVGGGGRGVGFIGRHRAEVGILRAQRIQLVGGLAPVTRVGRRVVGEGLLPGRLERARLRIDVVLLEHRPRVLAGTQERRAHRQINATKADDADDMPIGVERGTATIAMLDIAAHLDELRAILVVLDGADGDDVDRGRQQVRRIEAAKRGVQVAVAGKPMIVSLSCAATAVASPSWMLGVSVSATCSRATSSCSKGLKSIRRRLQIRRREQRGKFALAAAAPRQFAAVAGGLKGVIGRGQKGIELRRDAKRLERRHWRRRWG